MSVLSRLINNIRLQTNESLADSKYGDTDIIDFIRQAWPQIVDELSRIGDNPIIVRHSFTTSANVAEYILPPHVGEILWLAKIDTVTGLISWEVRPRSLWNPQGPRVTFEGNMLKLQPVFSSAETLELWYIPNGDISPVIGVVDSWVASTKSLTLTTTATEGAYDLQTNAYAGYILAVTDSNEGKTTEEMIVNSSSVTTGGKQVLVVPIDFAGFTPASPDTFELYPVGMSRRIELAISLYCSSLLLSFENDRKAVELIEHQYVRVMRGLRQASARYQNRTGKFWDRQTPDNKRHSSDYLWTW